jgi:hypothetical protein
MPQPWMGGGPRYTVEALLKRPDVMARAITELANLAEQGFFTDVIFARGTPEQVAGGAALYQRSESKFPDRDPEEVMPRANYPRTGWTAELFAAAVHKYGLEVPIPDEARRRNALDQVQKAQVLLANAVVRFVDTLTSDLIMSDSDVLDVPGGDWGDKTYDKIPDIASARAAIANQNLGYVADTAIVHINQDLQLITDKNIRDALPRENNAVSSVLTGRPVPLLGLRRIIATPNIPEDTVLILAAKLGGTVADEAPIPDENYTTYQAGQTGYGDSFAPVYLKRYREENADETIVRAARFPAMWLTDPKAIVRLDVSGGS